jgi:hypothetical protein
MDETIHTPAGELAGARPRDPRARRLHRAGDDRMSLYEWLLFLHIVAATLRVGNTAILSALASHIVRSGDRGDPTLPRRPPRGQRVEVGARVRSDRWSSVRHFLNSSRLRLAGRGKRPLGLRTDLDLPGARACRGGRPGWSGDPRPRRRRRGSGRRGHDGEAALGDDAGLAGAAAWKKQFQPRSSPELIAGLHRPNGAQ